MPLRVYSNTFTAFFRVALYVLRLTIVLLSRQNPRLSNNCTTFLGGFENCKSLMLLIISAARGSACTRAPGPVPG
jgi:hypothetical protein